MISQKKSTGRTHYDCTCANAPNCSHMGSRIISPKLTPDGAPVSKTSQWVHKHLVSMLHGGQATTNGQGGHDHTSGVLLNAARQLDSQSGAISHPPMFVNLSRLSGANNVIILNSQPTVSLMKPPVADTSRMPPPPPPPAPLVTPVGQGAMAIGSHQMSEPNLTVRDAKTTSSGIVNATQNMKGRADSGVKHEPSDKSGLSSTPSHQAGVWSSSDKDCGEIIVDAPMDEPTRDSHTAKTEPEVTTTSSSLKDHNAMSPDIVNCSSLSHDNIDLTDYTSSHFSLDSFDIVNFPDFDEHLKWGLESSPRRETGSDGQQCGGSESGMAGPQTQGVTLTNSVTSPVTRCVHGDLGHKDGDESSLVISDFSPEWSYTEVRILLGSRRGVAWQTRTMVMLLC